jgi:hypothetical protein
MESTSAKRRRSLDPRSGLLDADFAARNERKRQLEELKDTCMERDRSKRESDQQLAATLSSLSESMQDFKQQAHDNNTKMVSSLDVMSFKMSSSLDVMSSKMSSTMDNLSTNLGNLAEILGKVLQK